MLYTLKTLLLNGCMSRHIVHMYVVVEACIYFDLKTVCIIFSPVVVFPARGPSKLNNRPPNHHAKLRHSSTNHRAILRQETGILRRAITPYSGKQLLANRTMITPISSKYLRAGLFRQTTVHQANNLTLNRCIAHFFDKNNNQEGCFLNP